MFSFYDVEAREQMRKTAVSEKDKPDLERLEANVKKHQQVTTAVLAAESTISRERIRNLLNNHSYRVTKGTETDSKRGIPADVWIYKPTGAEIARPHQAKK
jgi:hypothetical protein